ncbi:MAG: hypothetical protein KDA28_14630, partial [Phycisphaerales bacterium]|nr:hypothetical protein [Phycisphaerales bacterium]
DTDPQMLVEDAREHGFSEASVERLVRHFRRRREYDTLVETLVRLVDEVPDERVKAELLWRAAKTCDAETGDVVRAGALIQRLLTFAPRHYRAHLRLADHYRDLQDWEKTTQHLEAAARLIHDKSDRAGVYRDLGEIYETHLGRRSLALESYLVSFICRSDDVRTFKRLEALYESMGRYRDLVGSYDIAIQHARQTPGESELDLEDLLFQKARIEFQHLNDPTRASETLLAAIELNPREIHYVDLMVTALARHVGKEPVRRALEMHIAALPDPERATARQRPDWSAYLGA